MLFKSTTKTQILRGKELEKAWKDKSFQQHLRFSCFEVWKSARICVRVILNSAICKCSRLFHSCFFSLFICLDRVSQGVYTHYDASSSFLCIALFSFVFSLFFLIFSVSENCCCLRTRGRFTLAGHVRAELHRMFLFLLGNFEPQ